jgi:hypothetical protein
VSVSVISGGPVLPVNIPETGAVLTNEGGSTVTYTANPDGATGTATLASGSSVTLYGTQYVSVTSGRAALDVVPITASATASVIAANTQTASYTTVLADAGQSVEMNSASATVLTIPPNATVAYPVGTVIEVVRLGAGSVTLTPGSGVTLRNRLEAAGTTSRTLASQYSAASLRKRATNEWVLVGDIA